MEILIYYMEISMWYIGFRECLAGARRCLAEARGCFVETCRGFLLFREKSCGAADLDLQECGSIFRASLFDMAQ